MFGCRRSLPPHSEKHRHSRRSLRTCVSKVARPADLGLTRDRNLMCAKSVGGCAGRSGCAETCGGAEARSRRACAAHQWRCSRAGRTHAVEACHRAQGRYGSAGILELCLSVFGRRHNFVSTKAGRETRCSCVPSSQIQFSNSRRDSSSPLFGRRGDRPRFPLPSHVRERSAERRYVLVCTLRCHVPCGHAASRRSTVASSTLGPSRRVRTGDFHLRDPGGFRRPSSEPYRPSFEGSPSF